MRGSPHLDGLRALVVDDDRLMVEVVSVVMQDLGLRTVDGETEGARALERLAHARFDILVCDLNMPDIDGLRLLSHVAALPAPPAIILISGEDPRILASGREFAEAKGLTLLGALSKPVTHAGLSPLLDAWRPHVPATPAPRTIDRAALEAGLAGDAVVLAYQPKVDVIDGHAVGVEALLRWPGVAPQDVVRCAEECGLIDALTLRVLARAVRDRIALPVACNVSLHNLRDGDMVERMHALVVDAGDHPTRYTLEVTETHLVDDLAAALETLIRLRFRGFRIAIDDYGTGAATMQFLRQLPSSELKIDRSFVVAATRDAQGLAMLRSAIALGRDLQQDVVAEGVETAEDVAMLRTLRCRYAQGYYYARPMAPEAL